MLSNEQEEKKRLRILKVAKYFLEKGGSIDEIATATGISSSSVQRYLHDEEISRIFGDDTYNLIQTKIIDNKKEGLSRGGNNYATNNDFMKDSYGRFTGSKRK